jgi:hypothetical protein
MPDAVNRDELQYIYDAYRDAALNRTYYGARLAGYRQLNFWIEIAIAVGAAGSSGGIAGLAVWGTLPGNYAWLAISGLATVLAVLKPVLQLANRIENYTKLYAGYTNIFLELKDIVEDIGVAHAISEKTRERYVSSRQLLRELAPLVDPNRSERLVRKLQNEINREIPPENLWTAEE